MKNSNLPAVETATPRNLRVEAQPLNRIASVIRFSRHGYDSKSKMSASLQRNLHSHRGGAKKTWIILLMEEILHQLIGSCSHYLQGFIHPRWLAGFLNHQQYQPTFSTFLIGYTLKILGYNLMGRHHLHLCKSRFFKYIFCIANTSEKMCLHQKKTSTPQKMRICLRSMFQIYF